jgi:NAD(P)-dependent dehydrogenase (short-subunit alcohol dehydrogenase family)
VDAVFNVAGISGRRFGDGPLHECSAEGWDVTLDTNVRSMFLVCRSVLRYWLAAGRPGAILNMASVSAYSPEPVHFATHAYAASKGAILAMSRAMAAYYAPHKIRVNAIAPGLVRTPMSARAQSDSEILEFIKRKQPLSGGMLDAEDVAAAALFLLGDESRHITGQVVGVDGGWSVA